MPRKTISRVPVGIRLATGICAIIVLLGLIFQNVYFYYAGLVISLGGMLPPRHHVDYIYNAIIRPFFKKPAIPKRRPQSGSACGIASVWISVVLFCWHNNYYWMASALVMQAGIVTFTDICFPSMIYNFLFNQKHEANFATTEEN